MEQTVVNPQEFKHWKTKLLTYHKLQTPGEDDTGDARRRRRRRRRHLNHKTNYSLLGSFQL